MAATLGAKIYTDSHGRGRKAIGEFTWAGSAIDLVVGLRSVRWFNVQSLGAVADISGTFWINSATASAVQDDPGHVFIASGLSAGVYTYTAIGD